MRSFLALIYKDLRLTLRGVGLAALVLTLLLAPALTLLTGELGEGQLLRPFPIALRDEDGTVMSRSLLTQLKNVELFSEVRLLEPGESDDEAIKGGAAAVVTIPHDFFYDVYSMEDCPVGVTLNTSMELESAVFESVFKSVMGIIAANHSSVIGAYTFAYGELTPELTREMYARGGEQLLIDALGRQRVFASVGSGNLAAGALSRRLAATVLAVSAMFFALSAASTLPEERRRGILPRLRGSGLGGVGVLTSKFVTALILTLPSAVLVWAVSGLGFLYVLAADAALTFCAFGLMAALSLLFPTGGRARAAGNLLMLLSLALGGTLWAGGALGTTLSRWTLPGLASLALECGAAGLEIRELAELLWPLPAIGVAGFILALMFLRPGRSGGPSARGGSSGGSAGAASKSHGHRLLGLTLMKLRIYSGGYALLIAAAAVSLLCGLAASPAGEGTESLRLGICDLDGTWASARLAEELSTLGGVETIPMDLREGERAALTGEIEGLLTIGEGYGAVVASEEDVPLTYTPSARGWSSGGAREIIAGAVMADIRAAAAPGVAGELLGRELTEAETEELYRLIDIASGDLPPLYEISYAGGGGRPAPFEPEPAGAAALAAMLTLFTAAARVTAPECRGAERRLAALPRGKSLSRGSDALALFCLALAVMAPAMLGAGEVSPGALISGALTFSALARLVAALGGGEGRVEALAPLAAVLIALTGGCFLDISDLSGPLRLLTLVSPAGLFLRSVESSIWALPLLIEGALLTAVSERRFIN